jgi:protein-disulfide isomerase
MTVRTSRWLLGLTVLGLVASAAATWVHYRLLLHPGYVSFCDVSATVSCTEAYLSAYGSLAGVPVALLGLLWFVLVLALLVAPRWLVAPETVPTYLFALSTIGLAVVLYLAYGSFVVLKTVCPLCVPTYVAVVGLFLISGGAMTFPMSKLPGRALRDLRTLASTPAALVAAILLVSGAATAVAFFPREASQSQGQGQAQSAQTTATAQQQQSEFEKWYLEQPKMDPGVAADGAAVLIVKFNDYQCPPCRRTYENYKSILAKYRTSHPGAIRFVTKDFPLDPECNFNAPGGGHLAACEAAVAVRLAEKHDRREAMEDWLFANQPQLTPDTVKEGARTVGGINVSDFNAQYEKVLPLVKADIASGGALGVRSTPTFFINGRVIRGELAPQFFDAALAYELKQAKR